MANITYDLSELRTAKNAIANLKSELNTCSSTLNTELSSLKRQWNTAAGKKFFDDHKDTWTTYVQQYVKKLSGIEQMIGAVIKEYEGIETDISNLRI